MSYSTQVSSRHQSAESTTKNLNTAKHATDSTHSASQEPSKKLDGDPRPEFWRPNATRATDVQHPNGSGDDYPHNQMTVLQQHIKFWDLNNDGWITPLETYLGFRQLGFNIFVALGAVIFINGTFSYPTQTSWLPDPLFRIKIQNSQKIKHGSDTGVYDSQGHFVPSKFEELFTKYAQSSSTHITLQEAMAMTETLRVANDFYGWFAAKLEWSVLFLLAGKRDQESGNFVLTKDDLRSQYDGTLFYKVRAKRLDAQSRGDQYMPSTLMAMSTESFDYLYDKKLAHAPQGQAVA